MRALDYISDGCELEVYQLVYDTNSNSSSSEGDNDDDTWSKVFITRIHHFGKDYVECDIEYENGSEVYGIRLYEDKFNVNEYDGWRFDHKTNTTIVHLQSTPVEVPPPSNKCSFAVATTLFVVSYFILRDLFIINCGGFL